MKKLSHSLFLYIMIALIATTACAASQAYDLNDDASFELYEVASSYLLLSDPERTVRDALSDITDVYEMSDDDLYTFLVEMTEMNDHCIWVPVHGGKRFHAD